MIAPLARTELLTRLRQKYTDQLVHGPLLGNVTGNSASFWVRTAKESAVEVIVRGPRNQTIRSEKARSQASEDFTAVASVDGLEPNTEYSYEVRLDGNTPPMKLNLTTKLGIDGCPRDDLKPLLSGTIDVRCTDTD